MNTPRKLGNTALEPAKVPAMQANLKANPPKPFDITRKLNVFTSRVQYVEFSASNYRLTTRQIPLPPELVDVADADLRKRITSRIRAPFDGIGKLDVTVEGEGKSETIKVDDDWLRKERKRIEDEYTFPIANFGRVILYRDRDVSLSQMSSGWPETPNRVILSPDVGCLQAAVVAVRRVAPNRGRHSKPRTWPCVSRSSSCSALRRRVPASLWFSDPAA